MFSSQDFDYATAQRLFLKVLNVTHLNTDSRKFQLWHIRFQCNIRPQHICRQTKKWVGLSGTLLNWNFLEVQGLFFLSISSYMSKLTRITWGVPQGLILRHLLFNMYMYSALFSGPGHLQACTFCSFMVFFVSMSEYSVAVCDHISLLAINLQIKG